MSLMDILLDRGTSPTERFAQLQALMSLTEGGANPTQPSGIGPTGGSSDWENRAQRYFTNRLGYSPEDWNKVDAIIEQESGWNPAAYNASSGAAGIAQKITGYGPGYLEERPMSQIRWLGNYLASHSYPGYGTGIDAAYQHKQDTGWY